MQLLYHHQFFFSCCLQDYLYVQVKIIWNINLKKWKLKYLNHKSINFLKWLCVSIIMIINTFLSICPHIYSCKYMYKTKHHIYVFSFSTCHCQHTAIIFQFLDMLFCHIWAEFRTSVTNCKILSISHMILHLCLNMFELMKPKCKFEKRLL